MPTETEAELAVQSFKIVKERVVAASAEICWEAMLDQIGPGNEFEPGKPMPFVIEAFPGGRYYRDLGNDAGHLWGHVQVIKPPKLLELTGPMFMSYAAASHVQYRLTPDGPTRTRLTLTHTAIGLIPKDHAEGVHDGWEQAINKIAQAAEKRAGKAPAAR